jgi:hypothetical protein
MQNVLYRTFYTIVILFMKCLNMFYFLFLDSTCNLTYTRIGSYAAAHPLGIVTADFNQDTRLDIVVANYLNDSIGVLLGYGNGTFTAQTSYSTGGGSTPVSVAVADLNQDNRLDIIVGNYLSGSVGVLLGYGNGSFGAQTIFSTSFNPYSVAVGDFNNDSHLDIVVANTGSSNVGLLLGYGNGSFAAQTTFSTGSGSNPMCVVVADFNQDNRLDIAVANHLNDNVGILLGNGNGTFGAQTTYATGSGSNPNSISIGDFNQDNKLDIVVVNGFVSYSGILLGYGNGTFAAQATLSTSSWSSTVSVADINSDSRPDIIAVETGVGTLGILLGYGNGTFAPQTTIAAGGSAFAVAIGDFNGDSRLDIAMGNMANNTVDIFLKAC